MTIFGLGIHVLIAIFFAIHAVRNGRELYWLVILFMFPGIGSLVYFFAIFLPQSRLDRGLRKAGATVKGLLDPGREMRDAQSAFDLTPTAHNQMRLANAMFAAQMYPQAVAQFDACLRGPFAKDPEIMLAASAAKLANNQPEDAISLLFALRQCAPSFRPEQAGLTLAKAYAAAGRQAEARAEFAALVARFGSVEARAEFALWALAQKDNAAAEHELKELDHARKHMTAYTRNLHQDLFKRLDQARSR